MPGNASGYRSCATNAAYRRLRAGLMVALLSVSCTSAPDGVDPGALEAEILDWRESRRASLMAPTGFLNLVGLFWLDDELSTFGSAADNDLVFPAAADPYIGTFRLTVEGVVMQRLPGVELYSNGNPVGEILIAGDSTEQPVMIRHGTLAWTVIERDGRYAVRLRDFENPAIASFPPLDYFPIDSSWRMEAVFEPYAEPRQVSASTVIEGLGWNPVSPGVAVFEKDGRIHRLEAYASGERLFFVFGDRTNGRETYPAGRFLYAAGPGEDGRIVLDFNRAYSPPCAFNDFSTCPVATPRNRLPIRIPAGELFNPDAYAGAVAAH